MEKRQTLNLTLRRGEPALNKQGYNHWRVVEEKAAWPAAETAFLLCDVWDRHWCRGANERLAKLLPRMDAVCAALRNQGVLIVHAPSDTMTYYADTPARRRAQQSPKLTPPPLADHPDPPQPVDASDAGCDTPPDQQHMAWSCQHPAIGIDQDRDVISDDGGELFNVYRGRGIRNLILAGVHTNMCILGRSFAIMQMVRWGFNVALVRDLTDTMYNPARPPYVTHEEGTRLVIEFIEKFWCPTVTSKELIRK